MPPPKPVEDDPVLTQENLAKRYHVELATIRDREYRGQNPPSFKSGKRRLYRLSAVLAWEKAREAAETAKRAKMRRVA